MPDKRGLSPYWPFAALGLLVLLVRLPDVFYHYRDWDEAAMMSQAWAMTQGQILYRDIFQIHPVGNMLVFMPFFLLFPPDLAPHLVKSCNAVLLFLGACGLYRLVSDWLKNQETALIAATLFSLCFRGEWAQSSHGEFYALFPLLLASWLLLFDKKDTRGRLIAAGILCGAAVYLKQTAVFDVLALTACRLHRGGKFAPFAAGFAAVTVLVAVGFGLLGVGPEAMDSIWVRPALRYTGLSEGFSLGGYLDVLGDIVGASLRGLPLVFPAGVAGAVLAFRKKDRTGRYLALWVGADMLGLAASGRFYPHYLLPLIGPLSLLSIHLLSGLPPRLLATIGRTLLLLGLVICFRDNVSVLSALSTRAWKPARVAQSEAAADYVRIRTRPSDRIFLYRVYNLDIFYLAQRLSNNGIYMFIDMVAEHSRDPETERDKRKEFLAHLPALVLVDPRGEYFASAEIFFSGVLKEHYRLEAAVAGLDAYHRVDSR